MTFCIGLKLLFQDGKGIIWENRMELGPMYYSILGELNLKTTM